MSQETIKSLLDKINLLFNVFMKEGLDKISELEKDLLKEQINKLLKELDALQFVQAPTAEKVEEETPIAHQEVNSEPERELLQEKVIPELVEKIVEPMEEVTAPPQKAEPVMSEINDPEDTREFSSNKPLRNLKEVIDLNKSFIFKAELFDNSLERYNAFINQLNDLQTERESVYFVERMSDQNAWDREGKVFELLLKSVEKRFLPLLQK